jgi:DNA-binding HxlR family transcriptional regulator
MTDLTNEKPEGRLQHERPIMILIDLLGKKWVMRILWEMNQGPCTFRELQKRCGGTSPTIINRRIKELTDFNLIMKRQPRGYELTDLGIELIELFYPLNEWVKKWEKTLRKVL